MYIYIYIYIYTYIYIYIYIYIMYSSIVHYTRSYTRSVQCKGFCVTNLSVRICNNNCKTHTQAHTLEYLCMDTLQREPHTHAHTRTHTHTHAHTRTHTHTHTHTPDCIHTLLKETFILNKRCGRHKQIRTTKLTIYIRTVRLRCACAVKRSAHI